MNPQDKWMQSIQMPPAGFGVVRPQPLGMGSHQIDIPTQASPSGSSIVAPKVYQPQVVQYQQMNVPQQQNWHHQQYQNLGGQKFSEQILRQKKFFEQKEKIMEFNKTKLKAVTADKMIENILANPKSTPNTALHESRVPTAQLYPLNIVPQSLPSQQQNYSNIPSLYAANVPRPTTPLETHPSSSPMMNKHLKTKPLVLPPWLLDPGKIPEIYSKAGGLVESQGGWVDTSRAYMLLMKTNLSPTSLGVLWEMVNRAEPGRLKLTEFHALLALVSVLQGGRQITGSEILTTLDKPVHPFIDHPTLVGLIPHKQAEQVKEQMSLGSLPNDEEFNDFVSAPVPNLSVKVEPKMNLPTLGNSPDLDDDFADFQSATDLTSSNQDDKYAAFRDFEPMKSDFADLKETPLPKLNETPISTDIIETGYSGDPFGEFEEAPSLPPPVTLIPPPAPPVLPQASVDDDFGDFVSSAKAPTVNVLDIKSETQSIASLELPGLEMTVNLDDTPSNVELFDIKITNEKTSEVSTDAASNEKKPDLITDKYSIMREGTGEPENNSQIETWRKCLEGCKGMLEEGYTILEKLSHKSSLLENVLKTSQMHDYLSSLNEVWKVSQRILVSCQRMSSCQSIQDLLCSNQTLWASVVSITEEKFDKICDKHNAESKDVCSVCFNGGGADLLYAGYYYHPACANLWLNTVDLTLPKLTTL